jgi:acyl-CoA carboxylase epsilon subunit
MTAMPDSPDAGAPAGPADVAASDPVLQIVAGQPTAEETAAVVVVLSALASQAPPAPPAPARSQWAARPRLLREPVSPGPGGWRASALPR